VLKTDINFTKEIIVKDIFYSTLIANSHFHLLNIPNFMIYCVMEFGWFLWWLLWLC